MKVIPFILFLVVFGTPGLWAQGKTVTIEMEAAHWVVPEDARFEPFDNRKTLWLDGKATVKGHRMADGRIEVEVYAKTARSFAGLGVGQEEPTLEEVYMRMHKSGQVDAVQYSPTFRKEATWQLYREHQAQVTFLKAGWNTLRVDVAGATAEVFVNGKPVLTLCWNEDTVTVNQVLVFLESIVSFLAVERQFLKTETFCATSRFPCRPAIGPSYVRTRGYRLCQTWCRPTRRSKIAHG